MFVIKGKLTGQQQLFGKLDGLKGSLQRKILRRAVTDAAKVVRDRAKANVPIQSGLLRKSIGTKIKTYKTGVVVAIIGARTGFKREVTVKGPRGSYTQLRNPVYYAHLVEFGTKPHALGKGSTLGWKGKKKSKARSQSGAQHPGTTGQHPLQRAWDQTKDQAVAIMQDRIAAEVRKL